LFDGWARAPHPLGGHGVGLPDRPQRPSRRLPKQAPCARAWHPLSSLRARRTGAAFHATPVTARDPFSSPIPMPPARGAFPTAPVTRHRLGPITLDTIRYAETRQIGAATVSFHPAGHVPGSAQIRVEVNGESWVVSGDYKVVDDGLSTPWEPVRCHAFISEC